MVLRVGRDEGGYRCLSDLGWPLFVGETLKEDVSPSPGGLLTVVGWLLA